MKQLLLFTILFSLSTPLFAAEEGAESEKKAPAKSDIAEILDSMGYPELQVVPRASERLNLEAKAEESSFLMTHWPIELSGLSTLVVGFTSKGAQQTDLTSKEKRDANTIASATTAVGAAWLVGGMVLGAQKPYRRGQQSISKYNGKDERSILLRERLAEEALERPAKTMRLLQNVAVITNVGVNVLSGIYVNDSGRITAGLSAVLAFLPLMFEDHNISVYDKHIEYKKKIYTPLKSASFQYDARSKTLTPMTNLVWMF